MTVVLAACGADGHPWATGPSDLSWPVEGYGGAEARSVRALAQDGSQLATGTLHPGPDARVVARLTDPGDVPSSAFEPYEQGDCVDLVVSPPGLRAVGVGLLDVLQNDAIVGGLELRSVDLFAPAVGTGWHSFVLADRTATLEGACPFFGEMVRIDVSLQRGWNHFGIVIDTIDLDTDEISLVVSTDPPGPTAVWGYLGADEAW
jgi:hypothetical protein